MHAYKTIHAIAKKYLKESGLEDIENLLLEEKIMLARAYLPGAFSVLWENDLLQEKEAEILFKRISVPVDELLFYARQREN